MEKSPLNSVTGAKQKKLDETQSCPYEGNRRYSSPEYLNSQAADLYSLGMMLIDLLEGDVLTPHETMLITPKKTRWHLVPKCDGGFAEYIHSHSETRSPRVFLFRWIFAWLNKDKADKGTANKMTTHDLTAAYIEELGKRLKTKLCPVETFEKSTVPPEKLTEGPVEEITAEFTTSATATSAIAIFELTTLLKEMTIWNPDQRLSAEKAAKKMGEIIEKLKVFAEDDGELERLEELPEEEVLEAIEEPQTYFESYVRAPLKGARSLFYCLATGRDWDDPTIDYDAD